MILIVGQENHNWQQIHHENAASLKSQITVPYSIRQAKKDRQNKATISFIAWIVRL